jgi:uncharacterized protein (TIGR02271 family)
MTDVAIDPQEWYGSGVVDIDGAKLGKIHDIYLDTSTDQPQWLAVKIGAVVALVPFTGAQTRGNVMRVAYTKDRIQEAPTVDDAESLSHDDEAGLYRHYGLEQPDGDSGHDLSGPTTPDDAMTRSDEELVVGTATVETGPARLRKWVETEPVTRTVVVSHEEVRVEREPITDDNRDGPMRGPEISEEEHELVLHEQRPVVQKEVVAKERVRLAKETVTSETEINDELRKERIETEGVVGDGQTA